MNTHSIDVGIDDYDVSLEKQEVLVTGTIPYDDLLARIKKTGKEVSGPPPLMMISSF